MRLQLFLRNKGVGSVRKCDALVQNKKILVNGELLVNPTCYLKTFDEVRVGENTFIFKEETPLPFAYLKFHKPHGVLCTHKDPEGRPTLFDFPQIKKIKPPLFFAGRLDIDSRGLVILSSDGGFIDFLTHPSNKQVKEYWVEVRDKINRKFLDKLSMGTRFEGVDYASFNYKILGSKRIKMWLREGKKREIKHLLTSIGNKVIDIKRLAIGKYTLGELLEGQTEVFVPFAEDLGRKNKPKKQAKNVLV